MLIKVAEEKAETFVKELKEKYYHNKGVTQVIRIMLYIINMDTGNINTILTNTDIFDIRMKRQRQFSSPGLVPGPSCGGFDLCDVC